MEFEWDPAKAAANMRKHGVRFADAADVLEDDQALTTSEEIENEDRYITIGQDALGRVLVVVYIYREPKIRIISVRKATAKERADYKERT